MFDEEERNTNNEEKRTWEKEKNVGENILGDIQGRFSLDLGNIFNRIWKFPYFPDFPQNIYPS